MEPAAGASKGGRRFPHVALLYVLIAVLTAAQLAGFLLLRSGLDDADRVSAERARRAERQAVSHVTELLARATQAAAAQATHSRHGQEFSGGEILTPPPVSAPAPASDRRRRGRRQTSDGEQAYSEQSSGYSFASGELMPHLRGARRDGLEEGSGSGGVEESDNALNWIPSYSRIPVRRRPYASHAGLLIREVCGAPLPCRHMDAKPESKPLEHFAWCRSRSRSRSPLKCVRLRIPACRYLLKFINRGYAG